MNETTKPANDVKGHEHDITCYTVSGFLDCEVLDPPASEPSAGIVENDLTLETVLWAAANFISCAPDLRPPEQREAVLKGLGWAMETFAETAAPPAAGEVAPERRIVTTAQGSEGTRFALIEDAKEQHVFVWRDDDADSQIVFSECTINSITARDVIEFVVDSGIHQLHESLIPDSALYWLKAAKHESNTMAERLLYMENAYNHVAGALTTRTDLIPRGGDGNLAFVVELHIADLRRSVDVFKNSQYVTAFARTAAEIEVAADELESALSKYRARRPSGGEGAVKARLKNLDPLGFWCDLAEVLGHERPVKADVVALVSEVAQLRAARDEGVGDALREALAQAAIPLEVLCATECDESGIALTSELKHEIKTAVKAIRAALAAKGDPNAQT